MKAESKSFSFLGEIQTFEIPFFQRAYVWKKDNWAELLEDLKNVNRRHFLGSIILKKINDPSASVFGATTRVSVIDGQQRLTTLSILIKAIFDCFDEATKANTLDAMKSTLFYKKKKTESAYHIKVKHSKIDRPDFEKVIGSVSATGISSIDYSEVKNLDVADDNSNHRILCCYKFFYDELKDCSQNTLSDIFNGLLDEENKMIVVIALDDDDHEQQIFDTINSAGVRLTSTDIVKNALFQKLMEYDKDEESVYEFYTNTWDKVFSVDDDAQSYWSKKKTVGRIQRDNSEMLLQAVAIIEEIFDPSEHTLTDIPDLYKKYISTRNEVEVKGFINKIIDYAKIYRNHVPEMSKTTHYSYNEDVKRLFHILDVLGLTTFTPYILFLLKKYEKDQDTLLARLKDLENFVIRRMIHHESTQGYNKNCLDFIKNEEKAGEMAALITNDEILEGLSKINNREATLLLFWVELNRRSQSPMYDVKELLYEYTLEHIMPQKWEEHWSNLPYVNINGSLIADADEGKRKRYFMVYSLGNMTLLNGKLNAAIRNNEFKVKMEGTPKRKGVKNFASLNITKEDIIQNIYEKGIDWNERRIYERQVHLTKEILDMWSIGNNDITIPDSINVAPNTPKDPFKRTVPKKTSSTMRVIKDDDSIIANENAADVLVETMKELIGIYGLDKVCKNPSVPSITKKGPFPQSSKPIGNGYYVNTCNNTNDKIKALDKYFKHFGLNWKIEKVEKA